VDSRKLAIFHSALSLLFLPACNWPLTCSSKLRGTPRDPELAQIEI
jgi:hypothetical protein